MSERIHPSLTRRTLIGTLASGALAASTTATAQSGESGSSTTYTIRQGGRCIPITPLQGNESAAAFYDWQEGETLFSSQGTTALQREDTTILFLYEDPDGNVSLVVVHEKLNGDNDGGSVTFEVRGLPSNGSWVVRDDFYDDPSNYDNWNTSGSVDRIDWTWAAGRTDGGVFSFVGDDPNITIDPMFNEEATLYQQYYDGRVRGFEVLSGNLRNPERYSLAMDQELSIQGGTCEDEPAMPSEPKEPAAPSGGPARIDISLPQTVNAQEQGFMMVEIRSTGELDISDLNLDTLELDGASPVRFQQVPGKDGVIRIFFRVPSMNVDGQGTHELELVGESADGQKVFGSDRVRIVHQESETHSESSETDENGNTQQRSQTKRTEHSQSQGGNGNANSQSTDGNSGNGNAGGQGNDGDDGNEGLDLVDDEGDDGGGNRALDILDDEDDEDD